ncbi:MAG TPA: class I SAM-dependent methyltransferase [Actinomycetota bacterium]|nr:class I SAM-dependent methyltransferase [Actinomycetota bacterium]
MTGTAAHRWRDALASWAIPDDVLARAPESPWTFPVSLFASRADAAPAARSVSNQRALEGMPDRGTVLDVGCGAGAASLPLVPPARHVIGVDPSREMLDAFEARARAAGAEVTSIEGSWPAVADRTPIADVVVCHHVVYNVPELEEFAARLTDHTRQRVIIELTQVHPLSNLNDLWLRFHGLRRPERPTADDAVAVLREAGITPTREDWIAPGGGGFATRDDLVAFVRRRLCLGPDRDQEIEAALAPRIEEREGVFGFGERPVVTLWWPGSGSSAPTAAPPRSAPQALDG